MFLQTHQGGITIPEPSTYTVLYSVSQFYNTIHSSTGLTPHFVVFGRHARLPVDLCVEAHLPQKRATLDGWVSYHQQALTTAYQQVQARTKQSQAWDQTRYNKRARAAPLLGSESSYGTSDDGPGESSNPGGFLHLL